MYYKCRTLWIILLCLLPGYRIFSQENKIIDSLKSELDQVDDSDSMRIQILIPLALEFFDLNNEVALEHAIEANKLAVKTADSAMIVKSGRIMGQLLRRLDRVNESVGVLKTVLPIARRNNIVDEQKRILNALALAYTFLANYDEALKYNFESLVIREKGGDEAEISIALNNLGLVYFKLRNHEKALEYYTRALQLKQKVDDKFDIDRLLINIGLCYNSLGDFGNAREYFQSGLEICAEGCADQIKMEAMLGLGYSYYMQFVTGDHKKEVLENCKDYLLKSYDLSIKENSKRFQLENLVLLARLSIVINEEEQALVYLQAAEAIATETEYNQLLINIYSVYSDLFYQTKEFERAARYQSKYITLKDSIYSEELIKNIAKVQTQFEERENIKTIADKEEVIRQQQKITFAIIIIAILATLLIIVLYRSNKTKKRVNAALSEAKAIIEDQNKQLLNSNIHLNLELEERNVDLEKANESLQRVNEELDNFIYKTSHDIRGPLASLKGMCNVALIDVQDPIALNYLHKLDITADKLNTILTRLLIVNQINHSAIASDRIDFHEILNDVLLIEKKKGLPPNLSIRRNVQDDIDFYSDQEFIRLILSNLIGNAIKFYNDKDGAEPFVIISIAAFDAHIHLRVIDNGIGIKKVDRNKIFQIFSRGSERSETGGIGLYITKTAVEKLGGSIRLQTTTEGYTEFYIQLPMVTEQVPAD